jgi:hypothetical protein
LFQLDDTTFSPSIVAKKPAIELLGSESTEQLGTTKAQDLGGSGFAEGQNVTINIAGPGLQEEQI